MSLARPLPIARCADDGRFDAQFLDRLSDWVWEVDGEGRYRYSNASVRSLLGYDPEEIIGRTPFDFMPPDEAARVAGIFGPLAAQRLPFANLENVNRHKDGRLVVLETSAVPVFSRAGRFLGYRGIDRDITARHQAARELAAAKERLEREVSRRTAALHRANARLELLLAEKSALLREAEEAKLEAERAARARATLFAAASHDLRQPTQSLFLLAASLRSMAQGCGIDRPMAMIDQALEELKSILDGISDVSRLEAGIVVPHLVDVPLNQVIAALAAEYRPRAQAKGIDLRVVPTSLSARADATLLERLLRNLVENALRYTARGKVLIGCRRAGDAALIEVADTGTGIPPAQHDAIFDEFYQLENPARDRKHGLGLGLAIVRRLALLMDGRVTVRSIPGRGSIFTLRLHTARVGG